MLVPLSWSARSSREAIPRALPLPVSLLPTRARPTVPPRSWDSEFPSEVARRSKDRRPVAARYREPFVHGCLGHGRGGWLGLAKIVPDRANRFALPRSA